MINLLPGLRKFSQEIFPAQKGLFQGLSHGQKPHSFMITCSDSRIDPTMVTQTRPGELFIVRNAGNIVPPFGARGNAEEAAIEFAIENLKIRNIILCGHSHCGAMSALMDESGLETLPSLERWLKFAQSTKKRLVSPISPKRPTLRTVIEENVLVQADNLKTHPSVAAALSKNQIRIYGWVYHFENGTVSVYDTSSKRFILSQNVKEELLEQSGRFCL